MNRFLTKASVLLLPLLLDGCGYVHRPTIIQNRDQHYITAQPAPRLRTPPGMSAMGMHDYYPIPERSYPESAKTVSLLPPGLTV